MLPNSHLAFTFATLNLLQKRFPALKDADYRVVAVAATGADLIDKPLAVAYFYPRFKSAVLFAHTLLLHVALFVITWLTKPAWLVYVLTFNAHILLDRLWQFPDTFYWPFRGWRFHVWGNRGGEQDNIKLAYWQTFTRRPELWLPELLGLIAGLWFVLNNRLYRWHRLRHFLRTGRLPQAD